MAAARRLTVSCTMTRTLHPSPVLSQSCCALVIASVSRESRLSSYLEGTGKREKEFEKHFRIAQGESGTRIAKCRDAGGEKSSLKIISVPGTLIGGG